MALWPTRCTRSSREPKSLSSSATRLLDHAAAPGVERFADSGRTNFGRIAA